MLELNGARMSKSTGNIINPNELLSGSNDIMSKAYSPSVIRFFMMQSSYRSVLDLTDDGLSASEKGFNRLMEALKNLNTIEASATSTFNVQDWTQKCYDAMNDDFNTPILIAHLFEAVKTINGLADHKITLNTEDLETFKTTLNNFIFDVLGLQNQTESNDKGAGKLNGTVELLIKLRQEARANKNFALSDQIRDQLLELGIKLNDGKDGTTFNI